MRINTTTAKELVDNLRNKRISSQEAAETAFSSIRTNNGKYHCFVHISDSEGKGNPLVPLYQHAPILAGVPIGLGDSILSAFAPATCASRILEGFISPYDSVVAAGLKKQGAILAGKTNMDEFGLGVTGETSVYGPAINPLDTTRTPGAAGGAAAAVAAGMVPVAVSSDLAGSARLSAAYCGLVGLRVGEGAVPGSGLAAAAPSLEQVGILAHTPEDAAMVFESIATPSPFACGIGACGIQEASAKTLCRLIIGIPSQILHGAGSEEAMATALELEKQGNSLVSISLPSLCKASYAAYVLASVEAYSCLGRYDGLRYGFTAGGRSKDLQEAIRRNRSLGFGVEVKKRILLGRYFLEERNRSVYYHSALAIRNLLRREFSAAFSLVDVVLLPTTPGGPPKLGGLQSFEQQLTEETFTAPASLTGLPAISFPGLTVLRDGLSAGVQLVGKQGSERQLLSIAAVWQNLAGNSGAGRFPND